MQMAKSRWFLQHPPDAQRLEKQCDQFKFHSHVLDLLAFAVLQKSKSQYMQHGRIRLETRSFSDWARILSIH